MTGLERLIEARRFLGEGPHRWQQHGFVNEQTGACCILGALGMRTNNAACADPSVKRARAAIIACLPTDDSPHAWVHSWNDDPDRTYEDVLSLLDRAIAAESAK